MDLGYRLLAVCAANRDKFTPKSAGKTRVFSTTVSGHLAMLACPASKFLSAFLAAFHDTPPIAPRLYKILILQKELYTYSNCVGKHLECRKRSQACFKSFYLTS